MVTAAGAMLAALLGSWMVFYIQRGGDQVDSK
jgi:hypothetical protein